MAGRGDAWRWGSSLPRRLLIATLAIGGFAAWYLMDSRTEGERQARCQLAGPAREFDTLAAMPPEITRDLVARLPVTAAPTEPPIAARGERFNVTDAIDASLSMRRFIRGGRTGARWFVWYEHGGRGYHAHIVVYDWPDPA